MENSSSSRAPSDHAHSNFENPHISNPTPIPQDVHPSPSSRASDTDIEAAVTEVVFDLRLSAREKDLSNIVDWDGEDDPEKPLNWSSRKKWTYIILLSALTLLTPFGSSMFAPGIPLVMAEFHSSNDSLASFVVSVYLLGYAFGPLFIAPLSELYGRLRVYHVNTALFIIFTVGCAKSTSLNMLIVFRFLAGLVGSCPLTIGAGSISDCFKQEERGKVMAVWTLPVLLGPSLGPVAGGYLSDYLGWRWNFWFLIIAVGVVYILCLIIQDESYPPKILEDKARRLRRETGNQELRSALQSSEPPQKVFLTSIIRPTKMLFLSPVVLGLSLLTAVVYGCLYLVFTTMPEMYVKQYGISEANVGLTYLGIGVGQFIGILFFGAISDKMLKKAAESSNGEMKPEYRLPPLLPAVFVMPIGLIWYGWAVQANTHWIVPIIGSSLIGVGAITVFMPVGIYLVDAFTVYAASATAANTVFRSLGGAFLPLCGRQMYAVLGFGWGNTLLAGIGISMAPMVWVFLKYGERIRTNPRLQMKL